MLFALSLLSYSISVLSYSINAKGIGKPELITVRNVDILISSRLPEVADYLYYICCFYMLKREIWKVVRHCIVVSSSRVRTQLVCAY